MMMSEIATACGFSSASYLARCHRPSIRAVAPRRTRARAAISADSESRPRRCPMNLRVPGTGEAEGNVASVPKGVERLSSRGLRSRHTDSALRGQDETDTGFGSMEFASSVRAPSPAEVIEIETAWIPLSDGKPAGRAHLASRRHTEERPVGAVLEYIPYRRRDLSRMRDEPMHRYFAEHGYASLRVDLRGSGDSSGLLEDEYTRQEWDDGVEAIAWIAAQPWCNGSVGMIGLSWGGFTALQIAALRPPALEGDHHRGLHRRSLSRRHALHRRVPHRRPDGMGHRVPVLPEPAPRSGRGGRRVAADVALPARARVSTRAPVAPPPVARRVLAARVGVRGFQRHRGGGLCGRRLGRWLLERRVQDDGGPCCASPGHGGPVGTPVSPRGGPRSRGRLPAGRAPLVGALAGRRGQRRHGRGGLPVVDAGVGPARDPSMPSDRVGGWQRKGGPPETPRPSPSISPATAFARSPEGRSA